MGQFASHRLRIVTLLGVIACNGRDNSTALPQRIRVAPMASPAGPNSAEPFIAPADKNTLILSWLERQSDSVTVAMNVVQLDSTGMWSSPVEIVKAGDLFVNWADFPSVVQLADGRLLAHWLQKNGTGKYSYDIKLSESTDEGASWSRPSLPHAPSIAAEHGFVTLLPRADSTADIVYLNGSPTPEGTAEGQGPPMNVAVARWGKTGGVTAPPTTLDSRSCDCCQTAAAMTTRGAVVLYRDRSEKEVRDIALRREVKGAWTEPEPLHADNWTINACPVNGPAISAIGDTVAAVWFTGANNAPMVQLMFSTDAGANFGAPVRIDAGLPSGRVDVELLRSGEALVTWIERTAADSAEVRARLVRRDGTAEQPLTIGRLSGGRASGFPRMAQLRDGVVMTWTEPSLPSRVRLARLTIEPRGLRRVPDPQ
jgi:hypothetical protein